MNRLAYEITFAALLIPLTSMSVGAADLNLGIFGNANMDDTIDELDVEYLQGIIGGTNDATELADANYDGEIDEEDIAQIELIINGDEKELIYLDCDGEPATVHKPVEKIIVVYDNTAEIIRILGAQDRAVGVDDMIQEYPRYFPELSKLPCVGSRKDLDVEKILELDPDLVILGKSHTTDLEDKLEGTGIDVVRLCVYRDESPEHRLMRLGYILDEEENAREYLDWQDECLNMIGERTSEIPEDEKLRVFIDRPGGTTVSTGSGYSEVVEMAGGINIAADLIGGWEGVLPTVDPEWVIEQNPDIIVGILLTGGGYETDDESVMKARYDEILETPGFDLIDAVINGRVYATHAILIYAPGPGYQIGVAYLAKLFYPELFGDLDPLAMHQEYIDRFQGIDYDVSEQGVFWYSRYEDW